MAKIDDHVPVDEYIPINRASDFIPGHPHTSTTWRWHLKGVKPRGDGPRVRLEVVRIGGRVFVTLSAIDRFLAALNGESAPQETEADVTRRSREARAALEKLGV